MKIPEELGHKVYDILEGIGARPRMREAFVSTHSVNPDQHEWRFQGLLGFGGKFWNECSYIDEKYKWSVSCYSEDETEELKRIIEITNQKLKELT